MDSIFKFVVKLDMYKWEILTRSNYLSLSYLTSKHYLCIIEAGKSLQI